MALPWVHSISQSPNRTALQIHTTLQDRSIRSETKSRGAEGGDVSRRKSTPAQALTLSSLWCDWQIPTAHRTGTQRDYVTNFWYVTRSRVPSTLSRYGVKVRGNVTRVDPP